jgi:hypothetical protein
LVNICVRKEYEGENEGEYEGEMKENKKKI